MDTKITRNIKEELNRTGLFLENIVFISLLKNSSFRVRREEPYAGFTSEGFEGTIDILAILKAESDLLVCLPIECKKADPEQKHWVFELRTTPEERTFPFDLYDFSKNNINYGKNIFFPTLGYNNMQPLDKAIQSFEFNEAIGKINRNLQQRPYLALKQSNEAVSSFLDERRSRIYEIAGIERNKANILYIPLVVTTANLHILNYKPEDIDWNSGTIKTDKLDIKDKKWIHYEFPLPYHLRTRIDNNLKGLVKRPSFIVNSNNFLEFIKALTYDCKNYLLD